MSTAGAGLLAPAFVQQFVDESGQPLAGGLLDVFIGGTTTRATVYQDAARTIPHPNPVVLDNAGLASIFLAPNTYTFELRRANGELIWTVDEAPSIDQALSRLDRWLEWRALGSEPFPSAASQARIYYDATLKRLRVSIEGGAYQSLIAPIVIPLGGDYTAHVTYPNYSPLTDGIVVTIDGRLIGGRTVELHAMAQVDGGMGAIRLFNVTAGQPVSGSDIAVGSTAPTPYRASGLVLDTTQTVQYRIEAQKGTTWIRVWGAKLVIVP